MTIPFFKQFQNECLIEDYKESFIQETEKQWFLCMEIRSLLFLQLLQMTIKAVNFVQIYAIKTQRQL